MSETVVVLEQQEASVQSITLKLKPCTPNESGTPKIDPKTLALVDEFIKKQASSQDENDLKEFLEDQDIKQLIDLINAAIHLKNKELLDIVCEKVADLIEKDSDAKNYVKIRFLEEQGIQTLLDLVNVAVRVDSKELLEIVCEKVGDLVEKDEDAKKDVKRFLDEQEIVSTVLGIVEIAHRLEKKVLMDLGCDKVADMIKDKTVEEVREIFNITNDFTPEEEQAIRDEHAWAFE